MERHKLRNTYVLCSMYTCLQTEYCRCVSKPGHIIHRLMLTICTKTQLLLEANNVMGATQQSPSLPARQTCWYKRPATYRQTASDRRMWTTPPVAVKVSMRGGSVKSPIMRNCAGTNRHQEQTHFAHPLSPALWELLPDKDQKRDRQK